MLRNRDFLFVAAFALALAYANLVGPHKLARQLYPNGEFALAKFARALTWRGLSPAPQPAAPPPLVASRAAPPAKAHARPKPLPARPALAARPATTLAP